MAALKLRDSFVKYSIFIFSLFCFRCFECELLPDPTEEEYLELAKSAVLESDTLSIAQVDWIKMANSGTNNGKFRVRFVVDEPASRAMVFL